MGPLRGLLARRVEHPGADPRDQAEFLGDRNELGGGDHAAIGLRQPDERFKACQQTCRKTVDRLEIKLEAVVFAGLAHPLADIAAALAVQIHGGFIELEPAAFAGLYRVQSKIGFLDQQLWRCTIVRAQSNADTGADAQRLLAVNEGLRETRQQPLSQHFSTLAPGDPFADDDEFVARRSGGKFTRPQRAAQAVGDVLQQQVPRRMPKRVVDLLEVIEIHAQHADPWRIGTVGCHQCFEMTHGCAAIGQFCQGVVVRQEVKLALGLFLFTRAQPIADARQAESHSQDQAKRYRSVGQNAPQRVVARCHVHVEIDNADDIVTIFHWHCDLNKVERATWTIKALLPEIHLALAGTGELGTGRIFIGFRVNFQQVAQTCAANTRFKANVPSRINHCQFQDAAKILKPVNFREGSWCWWFACEHIAQVHPARRQAAHPLSRTVLSLRPQDLLSGNENNAVSTGGQRAKQQGDEDERQPGWQHRFHRRAPSADASGNGLAHGDQSGGQ